MLHIEPNLDAAIASLKANLPGSIAVVNAQFTDFDIPTPAADGYSLGAMPVIYQALPLVEVAAPDWTMEGFSIQQLSADMTLSIVVRVTLEHPDADTLYRSAMRFARALIDVLIQPDAFGPTVSVSRVRGAYRVSPEQSDRMEVTGGTSLTFDLEGYEHRSV